MQTQKATVKALFSEVTVSWSVPQPQVLSPFTFPILSPCSGETFGVSFWDEGLLLISIAHIYLLAKGKT